MHNTDHNILSTHYIVLIFQRGSQFEGNNSLLSAVDLAVVWRIFTTGFWWSTHQECHVLMRQTSNKQVWKTLPLLSVTPVFAFLSFQIHPLEQEGFAGICSPNFLYSRLPFPQLEKRWKNRQQWKFIIIARLSFTVNLCRKGGYILRCFICMIWGWWKNRSRGGCD